LHIKIIYFFEDQVVVVTGGCGNVGTGIVNQMLEEGATCWVTSRRIESFDELRKFVSSQYHSNLLNFLGDVTVEKTFIDMRNEIMERHGKVNHVVVCGGAWWEGEFEK
jgi:NAD(P)-dependent dehydrogenase (short-subunit alcohol dehydrogenase family)